MVTPAGMELVTVTMYNRSNELATLCNITHLRTGTKYRPAAFYSLDDIAAVRRQRLTTACWSRHKKMDASEFAVQAIIKYTTLRLIALLWVSSGGA